MHRKAGFCSHAVKLEAPEIEPATPTPQRKADKPVTASPSFPLAHETQIDSDLARVHESWPTLPTAFKTGILAMIDAARRWKWGTEVPSKGKYTRG